MKYYHKKEELDLIQRIAYLSERASRLKSLGARMTDQEFKKFEQLSEQINELAEELEKIHGK